MDNEEALKREREAINGPILMPVICQNGHEATAFFAFDSHGLDFNFVPPHAPHCTCSRAELGEGWRANGKPYIPRASLDTVGQVGEDEYSNGFNDGYLAGKTFQANFGSATPSPTMGDGLAALIDELKHVEAMTGPHPNYPGKESLLHREGLLLDVIHALTTGKATL